MVEFQWASSTELWTPELWTAHAALLLGYAAAGSLVVLLARAGVAELREAVQRAFARRQGRAAVGRLAAPACVRAGGSASAPTPLAPGR